MNLMQSQTYQNLKTAFDGESKASTKYQIYRDKAREDGYEQIANIFDETSGNEREHAEIWLKLLDGGEIPSTYENLKEASSGENYEWRSMYKDFANTARREGFEEIAKRFEGVGKIESNHDARFVKLVRNIESGEVFCKKQEVLWVCTNCGNLIWGECAPDPCPVCGYPIGYYQIYCRNY